MWYIMEYMVKTRLFAAGITLILALAIVFSGCDLSGDAEEAKKQQSPLTGTVGISGTSCVGDTLLADTYNLGGSGDISYQWERADTANGSWSPLVSSPGYKITEEDTDKYIRVTVSRSGNSGSVSSAAVLVLPKLSGFISIDGIPSVGQILTVNISQLTGINGNLSYRWERSQQQNTSGWTIISGADSPSYTIAYADLNRYIRVRLSNDSPGIEFYSTTYSMVSTLPPITGTVAINGIAEVHKTLTADTSGLGGSGTITYIWQSGETAYGQWLNSGPRQPVFTPEEIHGGKYIRLAVERSGFAGRVFSEAVLIVPAPPEPLSGTVSISGTAHVGNTLTAVTGSLGGSGTISYQWQRADTADSAAWTSVGINSPSYTLTMADAGKYIRVTVSRANNPGTVSSDAAAVTAVALSGTVSISGTAQVGRTFIAATGNLGGSGTISYQWERANTVGGPWSPIETDSIYLIVAGDYGKYIRVTVTRANNTGSVSSAATGPVIGAALSGTVSISGTAHVGNTLTAATGSLGGSGAISYQWERGNTAYGEWSSVGTGSAYTLTMADGAKYIRVTVSRADNPGSVSSSAVAVGYAPLTGTVTITGIFRAGQQLYADTSSLGGIGEISYNWERDQVFSTAWVTVGDNSAYYTPPTNAMFNYRVTVSRAGNTGSVTSEVVWVDLPFLTATVSIESISGTVVAGSSLYMVTNPDLGTNGTYTYLWERADTVSGPWTTIGTSANYPIVMADLGKYIRVTISHSNYYGSATSEPTVAVTANPLSGTVSISGVAEVHKTLTAATGSLVGSGTISYQWERADTADSAAWTAIGSNSLSYTLTMADAGKYIRVTVSRANNTGSVSSAAIGAVIKPPLTGTVRIIGSPFVGHTLSVNTGALGGSGEVSYQWQLYLNYSWVNLNTTSSTFTLQRTGNVLGNALRVIVTRADNSGSVISNATDTITLPPITGTVTISGNAVIGGTLTADISGINPDTSGENGSLIYQWYSLGYDPYGQSFWEEIEGATSPSYTIVDEIGVRIMVTRQYNTGRLYSNRIDIPMP
jgi:hypothetical protein